MKRDPYVSLVLGICLGIVFVTAACAPFFTGGVFPHLELYFKLNEALSQGQESVVFAQSFVGAVKVKKKWVRISGSISAPGGANLPNRVQVDAELNDINTGRFLQRINVTVKVKSDGSFEASKKLKQDIQANSLMTITAKPDGGAVPKNSELTLCVDLLKKKADLRSVPSCAAGSGATLSSIQATIFTPTCAVSGCHTGSSPPQGLNLTAGQAYSNLVGVPSSEQPNLNRVTPGDSEASYLVRKIRGDAGITGARMPFGGDKLANSDINRIITWIDNGAKNN